LIGGSRKVVAGDDDQEHVVFKLVMRAAKGGKQGTVTRDLLVPADNEIAISTATNEEAEREAKERRKETLLRQWEQEEKAQALQTAGEHTFYDPFIHPICISE
jgi:HD superfamily phosphodiesterase